MINNDNKIEFTPRELEVMRLYRVNGRKQSAKLIAEQLYISKRTVDFHQANVLRKLNVSCVIDAYTGLQVMGLI